MVWYNKRIEKLLCKNLFIFYQKTNQNHYLKCIGSYKKSSYKTKLCYKIDLKVLVKINFYDLVRRYALYCNVMARENTSNIVIVICKVGKIAQFHGYSNDVCYYINK